MVTQIKISQKWSTISPNRNTNNLLKRHNNQIEENIINQKFKQFHKRHMIKSILTIPRIFTKNAFLVVINNFSRGCFYYTLFSIS